MRTLVLVLVYVIVLAVDDAAAQREILQQSNRAHLGTNAYPADVIIQGSVSGRSGDVPLQMYIKGDRIRSELGEPPARRVSITAEGRGFSSFEGKTAEFGAHAAPRRPTLVPFLDLMTQMGNPRTELKYHGIKTLGPQTTHHISLTVKDPNPAQRFLGRGMDEQVDLFIDTASFLILRSERLRTAEQNLDLRVPSILEFSDYRNIAGYMIPFRIVNTIGTSSNGLHQTTTIITNVILNSGVADSLFVP